MPVKKEVPQELEITESMSQWAREKVPSVDVGLETEQFLDHHRARGSKFVSWVAAWRTWMRNAQKWSKGPKVGVDPVSGKKVNLDA